LGAQNVGTEMYVSSHMCPIEGTSLRLKIAAAGNHDIPNRRANVLYKTLHVLDLNAVRIRIPIHIRALYMM